MEARAQFEQLLADLFDGPPDESRNRRINELLRAHPELQADYVEHLQLHALMNWRAGQATPNPMPVTDAVPSNPMPTVRQRRWRWGRLAVAAAVLFMAGAGTLMLFYSPEVHGSSDVLERLIDWNLELAQTRSRDERGRIFQASFADLKETLANSRLPLEDREIAELVLENGSLLTRNSDPAVEAARFNEIADKLVSRIDAATVARDEKRIVQLANSCRRVAELGVDPNIQRLMDSTELDRESEEKLERVILNDANRTKRLAAIMERNPEAPRRAIHRAMKSHHFHKMKKHLKNAK